MTLGLVRVAEGNEDEGARLLDRALALAPEDRDVIRESAGAAETRAEAAARLARYLDRSAGDDPDRIEGAKGTIRTYKALGERKVWVRASHPDHVEIPLGSRAQSERIALRADPRDSRPPRASRSGSSSIPAARVSSSSTGSRRRRD
jgi:hypothetical protein